MADCIHGFAQDGSNCAVCVREQGRREGAAAVKREFERGSSEGYDLGRKAERRDMVAWLWGLGYFWFAGCIKRGEHVGASKKVAVMNPPELGACEEGSFNPKGFTLEHGSKKEET